MDIENAMVNDRYWSDWHAWGYAQEESDEAEEYDEEEECNDDEEEIDDRDENIVVGMGFWRWYNDYWL